MGVVEFPADLVKAVARRDVTIVVGTGASIAAVGDPHSVVSWTGLLDHGLRFATAQNLLSEESAGSGFALLAQGQLNSAATLIKDALQGDRADWLRDAFDDLEVKDGNERLYAAIAALGPARLITTNYDGLLGSYLGRSPITWNTPSFGTALTVTGAFGNPVFHIHGYWAEPDSMVLDSADYERLSHSAAMEALQAVATAQTWLFVGCGADGLHDHHFSRLWSWLENLGPTRQHYALLPRTGDLEGLRGVSGSRLRFIPFGDDGEDPYEGLPPALEQLAEQAGEEAGQLQGVGRVAVGALDNATERVRVALVDVQGFEDLLPGDSDETPALRENYHRRLYRLLSQETRGADLCIAPPATSREDAENFCRASDAPVLVPMAGAGFLLGSPDGAGELIEGTAVEIDFFEGTPRAYRPGTSAQASPALRITTAKNRIASEKVSVLLDGGRPGLIAPRDSWPRGVATAERGKRLSEITTPSGSDSLVMFDLAPGKDGGLVVDSVTVREVIYGLIQTRFAGLRRVIEGDSPVSSDARDELAKMLAPLDDSAFALLRRDLEAPGRASLHHIAAHLTLRSAQEAAYEALTEDDDVSQEALQGLLPWVRSAYRRPVDDGTSLITQTQDSGRLLLAASLGEFDLDRARTSFARQRTLIGFVADQGLRLTYTLRSRQAASANSPPEREFLIHCFAKDGAEPSLVARQSVAAAVQSTFHGAYAISYSSAIPEDLDDVQVAAGKAAGYARRWVVPTAPSTDWPVSDHGLIADYIRTLPGDVAVTWECDGDGGEPDTEAVEAGPPPQHGGDSAFDQLRRLATDPAYASGAVGLRCCISVRGGEGADADVAEEVASLVGSEIFGPSTYKIVDEDGEDYAPVSVGHALLAMHAPFGRLYATSYDTRRRFVRPLKDQQFSPGVAVGTALRKGVERDYPEAVELGEEERFHHVHVVGRPGVGKTTLLKRMILGDLEADNGVTVVDPHGGLADWTVAHIPTHRLKDVVLVDLDVSSHAPTLNLLDIDAVHTEDYDRVVSEVIHFVRERSYHEWSGPVFEQLVRLGLLSMRDPAYPVAPALTDLVLLLANPGVRSALSKRVEDEELRDGWRLQGSQGTQHYAEALQWVTSKFDELTKERPLRATLGAAHSTLDIRAAVRDGKVLIFSLVSTRISEQAADFIGSMLLTALQQELLDLSTSSDRPPHFVYIDEFHRFATLGLERLVVEARKFRVGMTLAHQNLDQLAAFHSHTGRVLDQIPSTLVGNAGTLIVFPVSSYDRPRLAQELGCSTEEIGELARFQALARMAVGVGSIEPFTIEIEDMGEPDASARMADLRRMMREAGVWVPTSQIIDGVAERHAAIRIWAKEGPADTGTRPPESPRSRGPSSSSEFLDRWLEKRRSHLESQDPPGDPPELASGSDKDPGEKPG